MKTVCCICDKLLKGDEADPVVSHGACPSCSKAWLAAELAKVDGILEKRRIGNGEISR